MIIEVWNKNCLSHEHGNQLICWCGFELETWLTNLIFEWFSELGIVELNWLEIVIFLVANYFMEF